MAGTCPACGGGDFETLYRNVAGTQRQIERCGSCGLQALAPMPTLAEINAIYSADYFKSWGMETGENPQVALMKKRTFRRQLLELKRYVKAGPLLDVGAASGFLLEVAQDLGFEPWGVELSTYAANLAKQKFGYARIWNGTLETAPFQRGYFSAITMCDLLEHVTTPAETLRAAQELLSPGGIVLIVTPRAGSFTQRIMGAKWTHYKMEHLHYFTRRAIGLLGEKAGFKMIAGHAAAKSLTLRYMHSQLNVYRHWALTPLVRGIHAVGFFARDWPMPVVAGELLAILQKR